MESIASFSFIPHLVDDHQDQNHEIESEKSSCELDETMLSNIAFCMVISYYAEGYFCHSDPFWMTTGDSDVESESPFLFRFEL